MADTKPEITRRDFLKILGLAGAATAVESLIGGKIAKAESLTHFPEVPGDLASLESDRDKLLQNAPAEKSALPEITNDNRVWRKENPQSHPPGSYRSALTYSEQRKSYILHGGWTGEKNHSQTWEYKNSSWRMLDEGSTPKLHGHKMVDTPEGIVLYGGG